MLPAVAGSIFYGLPKTGIKMYEQFIELTDQIFWDGYAAKLAAEDPAKFRFEFNEFLNTYENDDRQNVFTGENYD